jgi:hypothetical protein
MFIKKFFIYLKLLEIKKNFKNKKFFSYKKKNKIIVLKFFINIK